jgi:hypothetical protein
MKQKPFVCDVLKKKAKNSLFIFICCIAIVILTWQPSQNVLAAKICLSFYIMACSLCSPLKMYWLPKSVFLCTAWLVLCVLSLKRERLIVLRCMKQKPFVYDVLKKANNSLRISICCIVIVVEFISCFFSLLKQQQKLSPHWKRRS